MSPQTLEDHQAEAQARRQRAAARARQRRTDPPADPGPLDQALTAITGHLATMPATTDEEREHLAAEILAGLIEDGWTAPTGSPTA